MGSSIKYVRKISRKTNISIPLYAHVSKNIIIKNYWNQTLFSVMVSFFLLMIVVGCIQEHSSLLVKSGKFRFVFR